MNLSCWFCLCFCVYLLTSVPTLWILRINDNNNIAQSNITNEITETSTLPMEKSRNALSAAYTKSSTDSIINTFKKNPEILLEQSMMFMLIVCRWLLPRGRIDRDSLSQLLIMYSAISADILDFSEIINRDELKKDKQFKCIVLGVWSWSLMQFTVVVTSPFSVKTNKKKLTPSTNTLRDEGSMEDMSETLSILMVFFMQDGPFLVVRGYTILHIGVSDDKMIFFTLKNILTLSLGIYRLFVLCGLISKEGNDLLRKSEVVRRQISIDALTCDEHKRQKVKRALKH